MKPAPTRTHIRQLFVWSMDIQKNKSCNITPVNYINSDHYTLSTGDKDGL